MLNDAYNKANNNITIHLVIILNGVIKGEKEMAKPIVLSVVVIFLLTLPSFIHIIL